MGVWEAERMGVLGWRSRGGWKRGSVVRVLWVEGRVQESRMRRWAMGLGIILVVDCMDVVVDL